MFVSYAPFNFDTIDLFCGTYKPSQYKGKNNAAYLYWSRSLYQRLESVFKFTLPWDNQAKEFFTYCLFKFGHVACFEYEKTGFSFQPGSPGGQGFYYQPTYYLVSNPIGLDKRFIIGEDCEIIRISSDWYGLWDIISRYAIILANLDTSLNMAIENSRFSYLLGAKNKGIAEALKKIYDKIQSGESLIVYDKAIFNDKQDMNDPSPFQYLERKDVKNSYIVDMILRDIQSTIMEFDAECGIPTVPYQKKERMVNDEANSKLDDGQARYNSWFENLEDCFKQVNDHFGTSLKVEKRYEEEEPENEQIQDNS